MGIIIYELLYGRTPFYTGNENDTKAKIRSLNYSFRKVQGQAPYLQAEDLFKRIFVHPANRITLEQILAHPWLQQYSMQQHPF